MRPPNLPLANWNMHCFQVITAARMSQRCNNIPSTTLDHMGAVLRGDIVNETLAEIRDELRLIRSAVDAGAVISKQIYSVNENARVARSLGEIVDGLLLKIDGVQK